MTNEPLILASASPRRRELLAEILGEGHFDVIPSTLDEPRCFGDLSPAFEAQSLALFKAADIAAQHPMVVKELLALAEKARADIGDYNRIGKGARFFDPQKNRPDIERSGDAGGRPKRKKPQK